MSWWFEYDPQRPVKTHQFYESDEKPHGTYGKMYGPFKTQHDAKLELVELMLPVDDQRMLWPHPELGPYLTTASKIKAMKEEWERMIEQAMKGQPEA